VSAIRPPFRVHRPRLLVTDYDMDVIRWWWQDTHEGEPQVSDAQMVADFTWNALQDKVMVQDEIRDEQRKREEER
jgi:hypothetical protein